MASSRSAVGSGGGTEPSSVEGLGLAPGGDVGDDDDDNNDDDDSDVHGSDGMEDDEFDADDFF